MTAAVHVPAMLNMTVRGQMSTRQVTLIGVDEATYADVSDFRQYLLHPENRKQLSFLLREDGYGDTEHELPPSGWKYRRLKVAYEREFEAQRKLMRAAMRSRRPERSADDRSRRSSARPDGERARSIRLAAGRRGGDSLRSGQGAIHRHHPGHRHRQRPPARSAKARSPTTSSAAPATTCRSPSPPPARRPRRSATSSPSSISTKAR